MALEIGNVVEIRNTRFIFHTNFAGDPAKDRFKDSRRKASIIIPNDRLATALIEAGFNVKRTQPDPESDRQPEWYVNIIANYEGRVAPKIYLVSGNDEPRRLDEDTIGMIDDIRVSNVNVILNPWIRDQYHSLYISTMYVEQNEDYDPFREEYARRSEKAAMDEEEPF